MPIELEMEGVILTGDEAGRRVCIKDDCKDSGGYLVLTWAVRESGEKVDGADAWVESMSQLESFVRENGWKIKWPT